MLGNAGLNSSKDAGEAVTARAGFKAQKKEGKKSSADRGDRLWLCGFLGRRLSDPTTLLTKIRHANPQRHMNQDMSGKEGLRGCDGALRPLLCRRWSTSASCIGIQPS